MLQKRRTIWLVAIAAALAAAPLVCMAGETADLPEGTKVDLSVNCPVCNMKVGSAAFGVAAAVFKDGRVVGFDGAGDLFRYVLEAKKFNADPDQIKALYVTEYGTKNFVDAKKSVYVLGSDATGHMGPEAVPFTKKEDADKFLSEHKGKRVATFAEVTPDDLKGAKKMLKMKH